MLIANHPLNVGVERLFSNLLLRESPLVAVADLNTTPRRRKYHSPSNQRVKKTIIHTLRPESLTVADVILVPNEVRRIELPFKLRDWRHYDVADETAIGRSPSITPYFWFPKVTIKASLIRGYRRGFPAGWGCLYYWTPTQHIAATHDGELRYRIIASSLDQDVRSWSDGAIRESFRQGVDFYRNPNTRWRASLFHPAIREMVVQDGLLFKNPSLRIFDGVYRPSRPPRPEQFIIARGSDEAAIHAHYADRAPVKVYTDGSHDGRIVGAAAILQDARRRRRVPLGVRLGSIDQFSIHDGEVAGLALALQLVAREEDLGDTQVSIYSDSQSALFAVRAATVSPGRWELADFVLAQYDHLMHRHPRARVTFRWIPRRGARGNRRADVFAKQAAEWTSTVAAFR